MADNFFAITCSLGGFGNEFKQTSFPSNTTSYRGLDLAFSNNDLEEYANGFFRSRKNFEITQ
jgi:hypothetical protein